MKNLDCNCLPVKEQAPIDLDNRLEGIALTFEQGLERTKPYTIGLVVGGFAAPIVGFNAGWITTTTASAQAAETPRVDALTGICSSAAGRMATARSTGLATLEGLRQSCETRRARRGHYDRYSGSGGHPRQGQHEL